MKKEIEYKNSVNTFLNTTLRTGLHSNSGDAYPITEETNSRNSAHENYQERPIKDITLNNWDNEELLVNIFNIMKDISTCFYDDLNSMRKFYQNHLLIFALRI